MRIHDIASIINNLVARLAAQGVLMRPWILRCQGISDAGRLLQQEDEWCIDSQFAAVICEGIGAIKAICLDPHPIFVRLIAVARCTCFVEFHDTLNFKLIFTFVSTAEISCTNGNLSYIDSYI